MSKSELPEILHIKTIAGFAGNNVWLTVTEVSNLTGLNPATIREACLERDGSYRGGRYTYRKEGKRYEILLSSLLKPIQDKYWLEHHEPQRPDLPSIYKNQENVQIEHEAYEAIADSYSRKSAGIKEEAIRRVNILDEYLKLLKGGFKKGKALKIIQSNYTGISKATLWRWLQQVANHPRQYWEVILAPDYQGRARTEIHPRAWDFFYVNYGQQTQPDATVIYRETSKEAKKNGWGELPSLKTFLRRWDSDVPDNEKILLRKGKTALKESLPHLKRDYTTLGIHELWESDGRKADVFCLWPDGTVSRPWVVVIREVRTRMPLGIKVYVDTNAELVIDALRNAVLLTETMPENFYLDNGTEYSNNALNGGQKSPFRHTVLKNQPIGILTRMGVNTIWATPYHGAAKSIESWWNVIAKNVDKLCGAAYTGSNAVNRPENCDKKHAMPIKEYVKRLSSCVVAWAKGEFGKHRGQGMNGMSPLELYNHLMETHTKKSVSIEHIRAMRPLVFRRVLSKQLVFQMTIPGFGQVEYTPQDSETVKRGYSYDILPDPSDPKEPALIYDGAIYMGEAINKAHTSFLDRTAGGETWENRSSKIKKSGMATKAAKERIKNAEVIQDTTEEGLPDLLQSNLLNVLKLPPEKQPEPINHITTQEDGSIKNTQTGEITVRSEPKFKYFDAPSETGEDEINQLRSEQQKKNLPEWMKQN
ncbi:DNA-binding domain-containing protein [Nitrosomonas sp. Is35]|uniref:DNA-binding domain-containing protein n=1 Tax=Nitrosomonas sp. Is35 TaxID=3080534 RepID=UPI00294B242D|nr:DNA-binding domain-containing protein [Nitrosomonas sp. Is35]MDV6347322.1 DNA-binding domain-containing protein [Nitrosomonas sp. Is35]